MGHVEVHTSPVLTILPHSGVVNVREGQYIRLECRASGVPQPTVQWSKQTTSYPAGVPRLMYVTPLHNESYSVS